MLTNIIDDIREHIGREVTFVTATLSGCPVCDLDPVTDTATDSFCPVCSGVYWIKSFINTSVSGHITWGDVDQLNWYSGGQRFDGDARVQVKYTNSMITILDDLEHVVVDGKIMEVQSTIPRGVPSLNRILIDLIEKERDDD